MGRPSTVEVHLRIPDVREPVKDPVTGFSVQNSEVRYIKRVELSAIPKTGDILQLTANPDLEFPAAVGRADWNDEKQMFVVACRYSNKPMPRSEYLAIVSDPEWVMKPLLNG